MLRVTSLEGNRQALDGGAMFGNAPRALWSGLFPPDAAGRIVLSTRAFLIEDGVRRVLLEGGIGAFFEPKLKERYGVVESEHVLVDSLGRLGYTPDDIDAVVLSHLHFDHAGALLTPFASGEAPALLFERANYFVSKEALGRARAPHVRDRASYIPDLPRLLEATGRLHTIDGETSPELGERFRFRSTEGHSVGMVLTELHGSKSKAVFCADLIPGKAWVHLPLTMGYDRFPERLVDEKAALYRDFFGSWLLFMHDPEVVAGVLAEDARGRFFLRDEVSGQFLRDLDEPEPAVDREPAQRNF